MWDLDLQSNDLKIKRVPCPTKGNSHVKFEGAWMKSVAYIAPNTGTSECTHILTNNGAHVITWIPPPPPHPTELQGDNKVENCVTHHRICQSEFSLAGTVFKYSSLLTLYHTIPTYNVTLKLN